MSTAATDGSPGGRVCPAEIEDKERKAPTCADRMEGSCELA